MTSTSPVIHLHEGDLPADADLGRVVAVDTETMGLNHGRDRLCLVQLSAGDGVCHLVRAPTIETAPNLRRILGDRETLKLFHYARFDVATIMRHLDVVCRPLYCTKIASRLARTYTDRHGLRDLCREFLGVDISKAQQCSDWGAPQLTDAQLQYAAGDVLHLHRLRERLDRMLEREGRTELAGRCFDFVPTRAELDLRGWPEQDIFAY